MSHPEQHTFVQQVRQRHRDFFLGTRVLEVGSRNVNGSVRQFFVGCDYVGIDCTDGIDVDVVCLAHEYQPDEPFDVVISCEAFEHDPYLEKTLHNVLGKCLRKGGLFVGTWGSSFRPEHGTIRTTGSHDIYGPDPEYYRGIDPEEFRKLTGNLLVDLDVHLARNNLDVYACGFRSDQ